MDDEGRSPGGRRRRESWRTLSEEEVALVVEAVESD